MHTVASLVMAMRVYAMSEEEVELVLEDTAHIEQLLEMKKNYSQDESPSNTDKAPPCFLSRETHVKAHDLTVSCLNRWLDSLPSFDQVRLLIGMAWKENFVLNFSPRHLVLCRKMLNWPLIT